ncbi:xanthine dehydrogenase family protein molybdopterin-binding subunit [bacterium]|nr:xanthine dehydrogenase family protein molybdopterin-binding subunit [bacterium]MBU1984797.1 xanthine dehydrogenase family protein molybdopterin-binding subunit [bacterium]
MNKAWRNDAVAKVTGRAKYTDDLKFVGMLHAVPVYTDRVHARILRIETGDAEKMEGVRGVLTAKDVPGSCRYGQIFRDFRMLADDKIRYHGDVIAVVVADTRAQAIAAAGKVYVLTEELPSVLDPRAAMAEDAILVHAEHGSNVVNHHKVRRGDVERGWAEADVIFEREFQTQFVEHAYLEPESALCIPRPDGVMEVFGSMQHPFSTRRFVAAMLGVPLSEVEVRSVPMGGGFGGKDDTAAIVCARAALAARITGRPVKMTYEREWSIRESYKRHPYFVKYKMGITKDGLIRAAEIHIIADAGAYCSVTPWVTWRSTVQCCGPYEVPNVHCDVFGVYTNNVFTGAMRGFGSPQMNFVVEQMVEIAAEQIGLTGVEFRRRNMVKQGSVTITGQKLDGHVVSLPEVLDAVLAKSRYEEKLRKCSFGKSEADELYGIGLAMSYRGMSLGAEGMDFNSAIINVQFDGSILLEVGVHENGQGAESAMILLLAQELGVDPQRIRYRQPSTSNIPDGGTTVASRATLMGGGAVVNAARNLKRRIGELLASHLNCPPDDIRFENEHLLAPNGRSLTFNEAVHELFLLQEYPYAFGTFKAPKVSWEEETGQGNAYFTWVYGCQCIELIVNRKTGKVKLLNAWAAHDVGRAVNPVMLLGQFYGGMAMGTGYGLFEEIRLKDGRVTNLNFNTYRIARANDMPEMTAIIVENPDPLSPSGAKGIGEPSNELMAPAIANAVYHATGQRHYRIPIRIEDRS